MELRIRKSSHYEFHSLRFLAFARTRFVSDRGKEKVLHRPFTHRLYKLMYNTIPTYEHARSFSKLIREQAHRQIKSWLALNTHINAYIAALDMAMARDLL